MELGHLTDRGDLVVVDSFGVRTLFEALRVHEAARSFVVLGRAMPMQFVSNVTVGVTFHRHGWSREGRTFLRTSAARLHRFGTSYLLLGANWKAVRPRRPGPFSVVRRPRGSSRPPIKKARGITRPSDAAPFVVLVGEDSVKGCIRTGSRVELSAVEEKEFAPFVLGKVRAVLEFPDAAAAEAFAAAFPGAQDPHTLDSVVPVDVDRNRKIVWTRGAILMTTIIAALYGITFGALYYAYSTGRTDDVIRLVGSLWTGSLALAWSFDFLYFDYRREFRDLQEKWPVAAYRRWAGEAKERAVDFRQQMRSLGIALPRTYAGLAALDRFLRDLPSETYFRTFAMDAGAYAGEAMMQMVGQPAEYVWRWEPDYRDVVLAVDAADHWVAPITIIAKVWEAKDPKTLDTWIREQADGIRQRLPSLEIDEEDEGGEEDWEDDDES